MNCRQTSNTCKTSIVMTFIYRSILLHATIYGRTKTKKKICMLRNVYMRPVNQCYSHYFLLPTFMLSIFCLSFAKVLSSEICQKVFSFESHYYMTSLQFVLVCTEYCLFSETNFTFSSVLSIFHEQNEAKVGIIQKIQYEKIIYSNKTI